MTARLLALMLLCCTGCTKHYMPAPASDLSALSSLPTAQAGVAEVDITPPPGLGLFGHGPEARIAEGTLLRLRCHAFVLIGAALAGAPTEAVALVPCELPAPSLLLQREVARILREAHYPLGADRVWISATHTHAGPAHYFATSNFSGPLSSRRIGFDEQVVHFLATRIASAVVAAFADLKPARWGWSSTSVTGLSRNRSYAVLRRNRDLPEQLRQQLAAGVGDPAERAVDPQLSLLRVEQQVAGRFRARAALLVFGLHPTVISNRSTLYGGDAFGYATRALSDALTRREGQRVLVAMVNGIEGDVTSARNAATPAEARRIGVALAQHAGTLWEVLGRDDGAALDPHADVRTRYRDFELPNFCTAQGRLSGVPDLGTPSGGGADDHPTFFRAWDAFNPGVRRRKRTAADDDPKYPIQGLSPSKAGRTFPGTAPIAVASLGNGLLVTVPAEVTTVVGLRIRDSARRVAAALGHAPDLVAVVGLTHEYLEYVASADEYEAQHYEGASTLYGRHSAEFLREQSMCLVAALWPEDASLEAALALRCGSEDTLNRPLRVRYEPDTFHAPWLARVPDRASGPLALSQPYSALTPDGAPALQTELRGVAPSDVRDPQTFKVQVLHEGTALDDEQGTDLRTHWDDDRMRWTISWTPELSTRPNLCGRSVHFRVWTQRGTRDSPVGALTCTQNRGVP